MRKYAHVIGGLVAGFVLGYGTYAVSSSFTILSYAPSQQMATSSEFSSQQASSSLQCPRSERYTQIVSNVVLAVGQSYISEEDARRLLKDEINTNGYFWAGMECTQPLNQGIVCGQDCPVKSALEYSYNIKDEPYVECMTYIKKFKIGDRRVWVCQAMATLECVGTFNCSKQ